VKVSLMAAGAAITAVAVVATGCGNKSSNTSSTPSSGKTTASSSAGAQSADYTRLLIKATDIQAPGDTFTMQQPQLNANGKPGVAAMFANQNGTHEIGDTILVLANASEATGSLNATATAASASVKGATTRPANVGSGSTTITGTSADASKAVTILLFTEAKTITTLEFDSGADDPVPPEFVADIGLKQDAAIKANLS
jgi:hypothetical protein